MVDRLAAYEDTGLMPEEITDLQRAWDMYGGGGRYHGPAGRASNVPLTLEELREMDGEPVWCAEIRRWGIVMCDNIGIVVAFDLLSWCTGPELEKLTLYRRKPEEGTT